MELGCLEIVLVIYFFLMVLVVDVFRSGSSGCRCVCLFVFSFFESTVVDLVLPCEPPENRGSHQHTTHTPTVHVEW